MSRRTSDAPRFIKARLERVISSPDWSGFSIENKLRIKDAFQASLLFTGETEINEAKSIAQALKDELDATIHLADDAKHGLSYLDGMIKAIQIAQQHANVTER